MCSAMRPARSNPSSMVPSGSLVITWMLPWLRSTYQRQLSSSMPMSRITIRAHAGLVADDPGPAVLLRPGDRALGPELGGCGVRVRRDGRRVMVEVDDAAAAGIAGLGHGDRRGFQVNALHQSRSGTSRVQ